MGGHLSGAPGLHASNAPSLLLWLGCGAQGLVENLFEMYGSPRPENVALFGNRVFEDVIKMFQLR